VLLEVLFEVSVEEEPVVEDVPASEPLVPDFAVVPSSFVALFEVSVELEVDGCVALVELVPASEPLVLSEPEVLLDFVSSVLVLELVEGEVEAVVEDEELGEVLE
jgi:hypothetical protein